MSHPARLRIWPWLWGGLGLLVPALAFAQGQLINGSRVITGTLNAATTTGTGNTYALPLSPAITTYVDKQCFTFKVHLTNTGAATLNINGVGAQPLKKYVGSVPSDLSAGDLTAGQIILTCWDGTVMQLVGAGGGGGSSSVDATHVLTTRAEAALSAEANLGALTTGLLMHTVTGGISTPATAVAGTHYQAPLGFTAEDSANKKSSTALGTSNIDYPTVGAVKGYVDAATAALSGSAAHVLTNQAEASLTNEVNLGALTTGLLKHTVSGGVSTPATALPGTDYADITGVNVFTSATGQSMRKLLLPGSTSGVLTQQAPAVAGTSTLTWPNGTTDFSTTGGVGQVVKQLTNGGAFTVGPLSSTDVGLSAVDNTSDATKNTATATLENKAVVPRALTCTPAANVITPNADSMDVCEYYSLTAATQIANPTATGLNPRAHQRLEIALKSATPQALTFGTNYDETCGQPKPTSTTGNGTAIDHFLFVFSPLTTKWCMVATSQPPALRITTLASATTFTCPRDTADQCKMAMTGAAGTLTMAQPTGTPTDGAALEFRLRCTNAQTFAWNAIFQAGPGLTLPATCLASTTVETIVDFLYSSDLLKWQMVLPGGTSSGGGLAGSTSFVMLPMAAAFLPTTNMAVIDVSEANPRLLFDAGTSECAWWSFKMPPDYAGGPVLRFPYSMTSATGAVGVAIDVAIAAVSPGDAVDAQARAYAASNICTDAAVPTTLGGIKEIVCLLSNSDGMVARDLVRLKVCRATGNAADTATGDMEGIGAAMLEYQR
jgi:hypothetical protein